MIPMAAPEKLDLRSHDAAGASRRLVHAETRRRGGEKIVDDAVESFLERSRAKVDWPPFSRHLVNRIRIG